MISKNFILSIYDSNESSIYKVISRIIMYNETLLNFTVTYSKLINSNEDDLILLVYLSSNEYYFGKIIRNNINNKRLTIMDTGGIKEGIIPYDSHSMSIILKPNRHAIQE